MSQETLELVLGEPIDAKAWRKRMKQGVIVTITIKRWRARNKLSLSELGIYPPTPQARLAYENLLSLGSKLLLPARIQTELSSIERQAREHLAEYAINTPYGQFVPYTTYRLWAKGNEEYKARFFAKRDEIKAAYADIRKQLLAEYDHVARHTYTLLIQQIPELMAYDSEEVFLAHFREQIISRHMKTAEEFANSFVYEVTIERLDKTTDDTTTEMESEEVEAVISEREARMQAATKLAEDLTQMNKDLVASVRKQKEALIDTFLSSLLGQLRGLTYEAVTSVLASIKEQHFLQGRPVIQLKNLVKQLEQLNFYQDPDIDRILTLLHGMLSTPAKERDTEEIQRQLKAIGTLTRGTILALGQQPREGREVDPQEIGIPYSPSDEEVREARSEIGHAVQRVTLPDTSRIQREEEEREPRDRTLSLAPSREERRE